MSLISPAVYREHDAGVSLGDDALQRLIDANEDRMVAIVGPHSRVGTPVVEIYRWADSAFLHVRRAIGVLSLVEESRDGGLTWTVLAAGDDYEVLNAGLTVHRLEATRWALRVRITYVPAADLAERVIALLQMVGTDVVAGVASGGLTGQSMGSWSQSFGSGDLSPEAAKDRILRRLRHGYITFA